MNSNLNCPICLGLPDSGINFCCIKSVNHPQSCSTCMKTCIELTIKSGFKGYCPIVYCPCGEHENLSKNTKPLLRYEEWKSFVNQSVHKEFCDMAKSLLAFFCGGCHTLKYLDVGYEKLSLPALVSKLAVMTNDYGDNITVDIPLLQEDLTQLENGLICVDEVYKGITEVHFPQFAMLSDKKAFEVYTFVLKMISNPERRANLHLRYLKDRPRIVTPCCHAEHCFKCKIKGFHDGKSCNEKLTELDQRIVPCPSCDLQLVKSDGCDSVTCLCGKQFSWDTQLKYVESSHAFEVAFPENTNEKCASILCSQVSGNELRSAKAWQYCNPVLVNRSIYQWFGQRHGPYPCQACVIFGDKSGQPEGISTAISLWKASNKTEFTRRLSQNKAATASLFHTFCPDASEKAWIAWLVMNKNPNGLYTSDASLLKESTKQWMIQNKEYFDVAMKEHELRDVKRFLFKYGKNKLFPSNSSLFPSENSTSSVSLLKATTASIVESVTIPPYNWCPLTTSNPELIISNDFRTITSTDKLATFPHPVVHLIPNKSCNNQTKKIYLCVDEISSGSESIEDAGWFFFGVTKDKSVDFTATGIRREKNAWGVCDNRSSNNSVLSVSAAGKTVRKFRKIRNGDRMIVEVQANHNLVITINGEFMECMKLPTHLSLSDLTFAVVMPKCFTMYIEGKAEPLIQTGHSLNSSHSVWMQSYIHYLQSLMPSEQDEWKSLLKINGQYYEDSTDQKEDPMLRESCEMNSIRYLELCDNNDFVAVEVMEILKPALMQLFNHIKTTGTISLFQSQTIELGIFQQLTNTSSTFSLITNASPMALEILSMMNWESLVYLAFWYKMNVGSVVVNKSIELATDFYLRYVDEAAFMAAITMSGDRSSSAERELTGDNERLPALAFMCMNPEVMQEWYLNDCYSKEPIISGVVKGCTCLPRCISGSKNLNAVNGKCPTAIA